MKNNRKYRICLISELPPTIGGISRQAQLLVDAFLEDGIKVFPVSLQFPFPRYLSWLDKIRIVRTVARLMILLPRFARNIFKADIVQIMSCSYLSFYLYTMIPAIMAKLFGRKLVIAFHGGGCEEFLLRDERFVRPILNLADLLTVPSEFLQDVFIKFKIDSLVVRNIVEVNNILFRTKDSFKPKFIATRHLVEAYGNRCVILAFSIIEKQFQDAALIIAGDGPERNDLDALVDELGLSEKVCYPGFFNN